MLTAATGDRKNAKKDSSSGHAKRNYRKRRGGDGGPVGRGTTETQTSVISTAYESVDPGENGEVVYCSLQASRLVQIDVTHMASGKPFFDDKGDMERLIFCDI